MIELLSTFNTMRKQLLLLFCAAIFSIAYGQQTSVAVLPSDGTVLSNDELEALTDELRGAALKVLPTNAFAVLTRDVIVRRLGGPEKYIKECSESYCIVDLGKKAQVDYVARASVSKLGKKIRLSIELYNVRTEGLISILNETAEDITGLLAIVKRRVPTEVFGKIPGASVVSNVPSVSVVSGGSDKDSSWPVQLVDSRDGKKYKTVKIGTQVWMGENLNYNAKDSKCYDNKESNCQKYGRLYDWVTAVALPIWCNRVECASKIGAKHKGICPSGWHLPSWAEWDILEETVGGMKTGGKHLKAKSGWNDNGNGLDTYGFAALPGGSGTFWDGNFHYKRVGEEGAWWSSSEQYAAQYAHRRYMEYNYNSMYYSFYTKSVFWSVRCILD